MGAPEEERITQLESWLQQWRCMAEMLESEVADLKAGRKEALLHMDLVGELSFLYDDPPGAPPSPPPAAMQTEAAVNSNSLPHRPQLPRRFTGRPAPLVPLSPPAEVELLSPRSSSAASPTSTIGSSAPRVPTGSCDGPGTLTPSSTLSDGDIGIPRPKRLRTASLVNSTSANQGRPKAPSNSMLLPSSRSLSPVPVSSPVSSVASDVPQFIARSTTPLESGAAIPRSNKRKTVILTPTSQSCIPPKTDVGKSRDMGFLLPPTLPSPSPVPEDCPGVSASILLDGGIPRPEKRTTATVAHPTSLTPTDQNAIPTPTDRVVDKRASPSPPPTASKSASPVRSVSPLPAAAPSSLPNADIAVPRPLKRTTLSIVPSIKSGPQSTVGSESHQATDIATSSWSIIRPSSQSPAVPDAVASGIDDLASPAAPSFNRSDGGIPSPRPPSDQGGLLSPKDGSMRQGLVTSPSSIAPSSGSVAAIPRPKKPKNPTINAPTLTSQSSSPPPYKKAIEKKRPSSTASSSVSSAATDGPQYLVLPNPSDGDIGIPRPMKRKPAAIAPPIETGQQEAPICIDNEAPPSPPRVIARSGGVTIPYPEQRTTALIACLPVKRLGQSGLPSPTDRVTDKRPSPSPPPLASSSVLDASSAIPLPKKRKSVNAVDAGQSGAPKDKETASVSSPTVPSAGGAESGAPATPTSSDGPATTSESGAPGAPVPSTPPPGPEYLEIENSPSVRSAVTASEEVGLREAAVAQSAPQACVMDDKKFKANLNKALSALKVLDKQRWFSRPVSDTEALGYSSFIHRPMSFEVIARNIASGDIRRVVQLQRDVLLMLLNAQFFNPPGHAVWKEAQVLLKAVPELFEKHLVIEAHLLSEACAPHPIAPTGTVRNPRAMRSRKY